MSNAALITDQPEQNATDFLLAKDVAETLHGTYPGFLWAVDVQQGQFINVRNLNLSGEWGFRIDLPSAYSMSELKKQAMRAGGELLERYRISRTKGYGIGQVIELKKDFSGRFKADT